MNDIIMNEIIVVAGHIYHVSCILNRTKYNEHKTPDAIPQDIKVDIYTKANHHIH